MWRGGRAPPNQASADPAADPDGRSRTAATSASSAHSRPAPTTTATGVAHQVTGPPHAQLRGQAAVASSRHVYVAQAPSSMAGAGMAGAGMAGAGMPMPGAGMPGAGMMMMMPGPMMARMMGMGIGMRGNMASNMMMMGGGFPMGAMAAPLAGPPAPSAAAAGAVSSAQYTLAQHRIMWLVQTCTAHDKLDVLWEMLQPLVTTILNSYRCPCCLHARNSANCGKFYGATTPVCKTCSRRFVSLVRGGITTPDRAAAEWDDVDPADIARMYQCMKVEAVGLGRHRRGGAKRRAPSQTSDSGGAAPTASSVTSSSSRSRKRARQGVATASVGSDRGSNSAAAARAGPVTSAAAHGVARGSSPHAHSARPKREQRGPAAPSSNPPTPPRLPPGADDGAANVSTDPFDGTKR